MGIKIIGDRVAIICPNTPPMLEAHFAIPWLGAAIVPVNCRITSPEVEYIIKFSGSKVYLCYSTKIVCLLAFLVVVVVVVVIQLIPKGQLLLECCYNRNHNIFIVS